ncbi:MAG: hypothetical protein R6T89_00335 [Candidatus Syntrophosphaera sp.]
MKKREFKECIESLIEREALSVEAYTEGRGPSRKVYVIDKELLDSWKV